MSKKKKNNINNTPSTKPETLEKEQTEAAEDTVEKPEASEEQTQTLSLEKPAEEETQETPADEEENADVEEETSENSDEEPEVEDGEEADESDEEDDEEDSSEKKKKDSQKAVKEEKQKKNSLKSRAFKRGWFSIALVAIFIAAVIVINLLAQTLVQRVPSLIIDTTGKSSFTLSQDTLDYIAKLGKDVTVTVLAEEKDFRAGGDYFIQTDTLLHDFQDKSSHIKLEYLDLATNPTLSKNYPDDRLTTCGIIVSCESTGQHRYLKYSPSSYEYDYFDVSYNYNYELEITGCKIEQALTSALLNVTTEYHPKITFISDINAYGYDGFKAFLEDNGFETDEVSPSKGSIPEDTTMLVLFAPNVDLDEAYVKTISNFLMNGGKYGKQLLYLPSESLTPTPNIDSLLAEWGMELTNGYALETDLNSIYNTSYGLTVVMQYGDTTYTSGMKNPNLPFCLPGAQTYEGVNTYARPVTILDESSAVSLLGLSDQTQVVSALETIDKPEKEMTEAEKAGVAIDSVPGACMAAIGTKSTSETTGEGDNEQTTTKSSHVIVFSTVYAVYDRYINSTSFGNGSYLTTLFNSLIGRDNIQVTVASQTIEPEAITITENQVKWLGVTFRFALPVIILITGIVIFIKRRNK